MKDRLQFKNRIYEILSQIDPQVLSYNKDEFWTIKFPYEYIKQYAYENMLMNTAIALPLTRGVHDGTHRKSSIMKFGVEYKLPYAFHCIMVCRMLVDMPLQLTRREKDILLAAALCHDMIEDIDFEDGGREMMTKFFLDEEVYEVVKLLSKRKDFTEAEEREHFHAIESNKLALLIKLSDRSHNVEDLYNMSVWKVHEYVGETQKYLLPMCEYATIHYPELTAGIEVLEDKIVSLTECAAIMVDRHEARIQELKDQLTVLKEENARLTEEWKELWEG
ncbi:MAG: HD domain-containing protein [Firmicutes bacterium]|nr:HD domain-containing protein [Bacillota bacterium]